MPVNSPPSAAVPLIERAVRHQVNILNEKLTLDELRRIAKFEFGISSPEFNALVKRFL